MPAQYQGPPSGISRPPPGVTGTPPWGDGPPPWVTATATSSSVASLVSLPSSHSQAPVAYQTSSSESVVIPGLPNASLLHSTNSSPDWGPIIIGISCMLLVICSAAVAGRLAARRMAKVALEADDFVALLALVCRPLGAEDFTNMSQSLLVCMTIEQIMCK